VKARKRAYSRDWMRRKRKDQAKRKFSRARGSLRKSA
jgi:hypothetical protein